MARTSLPLFALILITLSSPPPVRAETFVVDHRHVSLFEQIPPEYLMAAGELRMLFSDRSVGANINEGLDCFIASSWPEAPAHCRRDYYDDAWNWKTYSESDWLGGLVPERILFAPDPALYDRNNWVFEYRAGSWEELTCDFVELLAPAYLPTTDVLSYQFSYLNVDAGSDIADPEVGFFADRPEHCDIGDLEDLIAANPEKQFVFWTTSLARSIGSEPSTEFNAQMRAYCAANERILLDVADIESHTDVGAACHDNRDGVAYEAMNGGFENHPDDGYDYPAICQDYTTEVDGGHLGSVSGGKIAIAKAVWVLMARIAGWVPPSSGELAELPDSLELQLDLEGPNPARSATEIRYRLPKPGNVRLELFDIGGRRVRVLANGDRPAGMHTLAFETAELAAGAYTVRLQVGGGVALQRIVVVH